MERTSSFAAEFAQRPCDLERDAVCASDDRGHSPLSRFDVKAMVRQRWLRPELMDQPNLDPAAHVDALRGLRRLNKVCRSPAILWPEIALTAKLIAPRRLRVLDLACGGGDNAIAVARLAAREGLRVEMAGCDISAVAIRESRDRASASGAESLSFFEYDVLNQPLPDDFHVVMCSLFLHHLSDEQGVDLMRRMAAAATTLVLVSDLRRTWIGYGLAWFGSRLLSRSPIVHVDGPRSVAAAFTEREAWALACRSGLDGATFTRHWPQRWRLSWRKP